MTRVESHEVDFKENIKYKKDNFILIKGSNYFKKIQ